VRAPFLKQAISRLVACFAEKGLAEYKRALAKEDSM
jgi:hypothetical protein